VHRAAARGSVPCLRASLGDFAAAAGATNSNATAAGAYAATGSNPGSAAPTPRDPLAVPRLLSLQTRTDGSTALHLACAGPHPSAAKYLLDLGADARGGAARRRTPLYEAAHAGCIELVRLLIARGAAVGPTELGAAADDKVRAAMNAADSGGGFSFAAPPHPR
jgi:hypothetical protein